jgi:hypothetical protein
LACRCTQRRQSWASSPTGKRAVIKFSALVPTARRCISNHSDSASHPTSRCS